MMVFLKKCFLSFGAFVLRRIVGLRYSITVKGKDVLDRLDKKKGVLILSNHVSQIDPFMLYSVVGGKMIMEPVVTTRFYYYPFAGFFMKLLSGHPVVEIGLNPSKENLKSLDNLLSNVLNSLKNKKQVLLYPAGHLKVTPDERLGGRSMAYNTVRLLKGNIEIVLVRVTGLWGSMFSKVYYKETPDFWKTVFIGLKIVLKNLIFFVPKRKVTIEFSLLSKQLPENCTKEVFNKTLTSFYNQYGENNVQKEPLVSLRHYFWSDKLNPIPKYDAPASIKSLEVPPKIKRDIFLLVSEIVGCNVKDINYDQDLMYHLHLDSMQVAELYSYLEFNYGIGDNIYPKHLVKVEDLLLVAIGKKYVQAPVAEEKMAKISQRGAPSYMDGNTLIEVFLNKCQEMGGIEACHDNISGTCSYDKLKLSVILLAKKLKKMKGEYIGILLPSSVAVQILTQAIMLAGKKVVPINWTVGSRFIDYAVNLLKVEIVLTSKNFLDKIENLSLGTVADKLIFVEDLKKGITFYDKLMGLWVARKSTKSILKRFNFEKRSDDVALCLFTSGSTAHPKCVVLTHTNVLTNAKESTIGMNLTSKDVQISTLPSFHIFGFVGGMVPLLMGIFCIYSPDPLDASSIAEEIFKWQVTFTMMAPSFYSHLFKKVHLDKLNSLRICGGGSESTPESIRESVNSLPFAVYVEGYGLTETSPVIAINSPYLPSRGVGKILPSIDLVIVSPYGLSVMEEGNKGEICVRGPSVFSGYYKQSNDDTFVFINGKRYFRTGDLGFVDGNYLHYMGRLKFTIKRGGEMISFAAIEQVLEDALGGDSAKSFVCMLIKHKGVDGIMLVSSIDITLEKVNSVLIEEGLSQIYKVNKVRIVDSIPVLKSGKIAYGQLNSKLESKSICSEALRH